jgi:hypothetical protein
MRRADALPGIFRTALPVLAALAVFSAASPRAAAQDSRKKQEIIFAELPMRTVEDDPFDLSAKATSGLPVTFEVVSGPAVLDGRRIKLTGAPGLVIVRASQGGNPAFLPAVQAERAFTVGRRAAAPAILAQPVGTRVAIGALALIFVEATGEPVPTFQWRKDGIPVTGATDSRFTIPSAAPGDAGAYDVVASNTLGSVTSQRARVTVGKRSQTITFQGPTASPLGMPVTLSATASSGLPVRFDVISGTATLNGSLMTAQGGVVVIQASQPGDATYEAATPVTQRF